MVWLLVTVILTMNDNNMVNAQQSYYQWQATLNARDKQV